MVRKNDEMDGFQEWAIDPLNSETLSIHHERHKGEAWWLENRTSPLELNALTGIVGMISDFFFQKYDFYIELFVFYKLIY